jgi:hypothetical protein
MWNGPRSSDVLSSRMLGKSEEENIVFRSGLGNKTAAIFNK